MLCPASPPTSGRPHSRAVVQPGGFSGPVPGQYGNVGRNTLSSPGTVSIDLSIFKNFDLTERARLQFRSEFFNLPNHPNFRGIDTTYDSPSAGELSTAAGSQADSICSEAAFLIPSRRLTLPGNRARLDLGLVRHSRIKPTLRLTICYFQSNSGSRILERRNHDLCDRAWFR